MEEKVKTKRHILDSLKLKEFADDNFKFDENGRKFSEMVKKHCGKRRNCSLQAIFPFSHSVFKRLVLMTRENKGLFGKGLYQSATIKTRRVNLLPNDEVLDWFKFKEFADDKINLTLK